MTHDELRALREALGLNQAQMAREMGLSLRPYQELEAGDKQVRARHVNAAERVSLRIAVAKREPMLAVASVRAEALELARMITGAPTPAPRARAARSAAHRA